MYCYTQGRIGSTLSGVSEASNIERAALLLEQLHDRGYYGFGPDRPGTLWAAIARAHAADDLTDAEVEVLNGTLG